MIAHTRQDSRKEQERIEMAKQGRCFEGLHAAVGLAGALLLLLAPSLNAQTAPPGPEVCQGCHADHVESYLNSKHGQMGNLKGPANHGGCVVCHAQAAEHVAAGGGRGAGGMTSPRSKSLGADARSQICLNCHADNRHLAFWESGRHKKNDVACSDCHVLHEMKTSTLRKDNPSITPFVTTSRQLQYETCTACHKQIRSQLLKPSHHPILEGKLNCTSCHNPHGALSPAMVKEESVNQLCTSCHADKRGPFMQEHPPVEENCLACHTSHGSIHNKLLSERVPNICQDCHDAARHPGTFYSGNQGFGSSASGAPNTRLVARACLNCHTTIHGSNAPAMRGKFFLR
jgi:DmsE family decaheme c-type cytochrome